MSTPRLFIGTPAYQCAVSSAYAASLAILVAEMTKAGATPIVHFASSAQLPELRNELVAKFLKSDADVLGFIDADESFSATDIMDLLQSGFDVVAGAVPRKRFDMIDDFAFTPRCNTKPIKHCGKRYIEAESAGTGCMFVRRSVFERIIAAHGASIRYRQGGGAETKH